MREVVETAAAEFLVDIVHEDFILRLALHVQNLQHRAREQAWSRNPLTRSLKSTYPMIFEVAVFIASGLQERLGIPLLDDEIAYIAMHVGGRLERSRRADQLLTATIVCPGYYELHELLRSSVDRSLGQAIEVVGVETRVDPDWASIDTDLVLTTIDPAVAGRSHRADPAVPHRRRRRAGAGRGRPHPPRAAPRAPAHRARALLRAASAFVRGLDADRRRGGRHPAPRRAARRAGRDRRRLRRAHHRARADVVHRVHRRARRAARAGHDGDPHRDRRSASPTRRSRGATGRVQVVALVAFSETDREAFQTVFEQFVEVFSERESVQRIVRRGTDFTRLPRRARRRHRRLSGVGSHELPAMPRVGAIAAGDPGEAPSAADPSPGRRRSCRPSRTAGHSCGRIEKTTVSRSVPSGPSRWLRRTPSCFAPSRAIASRDCRLCQCVRNSTAIASHASNACAEQQQLRGGVDRGALRLDAEPGVADLDVPVGLVDVAERRHADDAARVEPPHRPRVHRSLGRASASRCAISACDAVGRRHGGVPGVLEPDGGRRRAPSAWSALSGSSRT